MSSAPLSAATRADFAHVQTWVFDFDNTLYSASSAIFAQVDERIRDYVCNYLSLSIEDAYRLQKAYFHEHGTTLNGLMSVHGMKPAEYLEYVHDIDVSPISPDPLLSSALNGLLGRKVIFTNGTVAHAERVIERLGIAAHFDDILDIVGLGYRPKPQAAAYECLLTRTGLKPKHTAMFEDVARNLVPAYQLGMTTVWVKRTDEVDKSHEGAQDGHIHYSIENLSSFLATLI